jgi:large subunit ribosomal protein L13
MVRMRSQTGQRTYMARPKEQERRWYVVDAAGQVLGRVAAQVAYVLQGKHKPDYTPHVDMGDGVIVVNAAQVVLTGRKLRQKKEIRHSRYPGGLKAIPYQQVMATHPERALERAIRGMLPKGRLGREMFRHLRVYAGSQHQHAAQAPQPWPGWEGLDRMEKGGEN